MSPDGCLTPSSAFYRTEQPSALGTCNKRRCSTRLKINFVSLLHQSLAAANCLLQPQLLPVSFPSSLGGAGSVGHAACSLVFGKHQQLCILKEVSALLVLQSFWHCKSHQQAGTNSAILLCEG